MDQAIRLFARSGYDGVSMRDLAAAAGVSVSALYYHFADKEQLYLQVVAEACQKETGSLKAVLVGDGPPWERLETFISQMAGMLARDKDLLRLMQWVLLDNDEPRMSRLVREVFLEWHVAVQKLARELGGGHDPHLLAMSIISLVVHPFVSENAQRFLPAHPNYLKSPAVLAEHVLRLLRGGLARGTQADDSPEAHDPAVEPSAGDDG